MVKRIVLVLFAMLLAESVNAIELIAQWGDRVSVGEISSDSARKLCEGVLQTKGFPVVLTDNYIFVYMNDLEDPHGYEFVNDPSGEDSIIEDLFPIRIADLKPSARTALADRDLKKFFRLMGIVYTVHNDKTVTSKVNYTKFEQQCNLVCDVPVDSLDIEYYSEYR